MTNPADHTPVVHVTPPPAGPTEADLSALARMLGQYAPFDGRHELRLPGISAVRGSRLNDQLVHGVYRPSVCIVARGAKRVFLGSEMYEYNESTMLLSSLELPVAAQIVRASHAEPFLGMTVELNPHRVAELAHRVFPYGLPPLKDTRGIGVGEATTEIVQAATRLLTLLHDERDAELLAPLVVDELLIRLLRGPMGGRVAQIGQGESHVQRVARAVDWVRAHFDQPMNVEALAEMVHMSPSTFHGHFKAVTNMSPLQFQKALRLREARRLMLTAMLDVTTVSRQVGYTSASQFIREYGRLFGNAPARDIALLRAQGQAPAALN